MPREESSFEKTMNLNIIKLLTNSPSPIFNTRRNTSEMLGACHRFFSSRPGGTEFSDSLLRSKELVDTVFSTQEEWIAYAEEHIRDLRLDDPKSFLITQLFAPEHLIGVVIRKMAGGYSVTVTNKGRSRENPLYVERGTPPHAEYEEYIIPEAKLREVTRCFGVLYKREFDLDRAYEVLREASSQMYRLSLASKEQIVGNCYFTENKLAIKYASFTSDFTLEELRNLRYGRTPPLKPKWHLPVACAPGQHPSRDERMFEFSTKEVTSEIILQLEAVHPESSRQMELFRGRYLKNKDFRIAMKDRAIGLDAAMSTAFGDGVDRPDEIRVLSFLNCESILRHGAQISEFFRGRMREDFEKLRKVVGFCSDPSTNPLNTEGLIIKDFKGAFDSIGIINPILIEEIENKLSLQFLDESNFHNDIRFLEKAVIHAPNDPVLSFDLANHYLAEANKKSKFDLILNLVHMKNARRASFILKALTHYMQTYEKGGEWFRPVIKQKCEELEQAARKVKRPDLIGEIYRFRMRLVTRGIAAQQNYPSLIH